MNRPSIKGVVLSRLSPDFQELARVIELSPRGYDEPVQALCEYEATDGNVVNVAVYAPPERACAAVLACAQPGDLIRVTGVREASGEGGLVGGHFVLVAAEVIKHLGVELGAQSEQTP